MYVYTPPAYAPLLVTVRKRSTLPNVLKLYCSRSLSLYFSLVAPQFLYGGTFESETSAFADYFVFAFLTNTIFQNIAIL